MAAAQKVGIREVLQVENKEAPRAALREEVREDQLVSSSGPATSIPLCDDDESPAAASCKPWMLVPHQADTLLT